MSPRQAYELLFFDYMGLSPDQLPVVEESDSRITWLSANPCPTLEACARLGLDTRTVCRSIYEKPTQVFLSRLDPGLRFVRDYSTIRPQATHCRESIVRLDLDSLMREAIQEALAAKAEGNKGYGAVLVLGDQVLARAHDTISTDKDFCQHGEFKAIRQAVAALNGSDLCGALLLSTCEPCPMCMGLTIWANVTTVIYGSSIVDTAAMGRTRIMVGAAEMAERSPFTVEVMGGLLKEECDRLYA
jgi:tRNA(Arg) A34 adenosine deaminase TadA